MEYEFLSSQIELLYPRARFSMLNSGDIGFLVKYYTLNEKYICNNRSLFIVSDSWDDVIAFRKFLFSKGRSYMAHLVTNVCLDQKRIEQMKLIASTGINSFKLKKIKSKFPYVSIDRKSELYIDNKGSLNSLSINGKLSTRQSLVVQLRTDYDIHILQMLIGSIEGKIIVPI